MSKWRLAGGISGLFHRRAERFGYRNCKRVCHHHIGTNLLCQGAILQGDNFVLQNGTLGTLPDFLLNDIGLTRSDVDQITR